MLPSMANEAPLPLAPAMRVPSPVMIARRGSWRGVWAWGAEAGSGAAVVKWAASKGRSLFSIAATEPPRTADPSPNESSM